MIELTRRLVPFAPRPGIETAELKVKKAIKDAVKTGHVSSAKLLAKEMARSRKAKERLVTSKAQLNSVSMQIKTNMATQRVAASMQKSAEMAAVMNSVINVKEISETMRTMSREMEKAGLIEEMMDDMFEDLDGSDIEEEADEAIEQVLTEILGEGGLVGTSTPTAAVAEPEPVKEDKDVAAMQARLAALQG